VVNVQVIFLEMKSKSDLIKKMSKLCLCCDLNLSKRLISKQITLAHQHLNIVCAMKAKAKATDCTKSQSLSRKIRALKLQEKCLVFKQALCMYHSTADLNHMITQLKEEKPPSEILTSVNHALEDCNWLAVNLFSSATTNFSFSAIVD